MNERFFKDEITVFHFENDDVERIFYKKVYFRHNKKSNLIDKGLEKGSVGSITVPTTEKIKIDVGDYVIEGSITEKFSEKTLFKNYQVFKVISVDDNRKGKLQHYLIGVSE